MKPSIVRLLTGIVVLLTMICTAMPASAQTEPALTDS